MKNTHTYKGLPDRQMQEIADMTTQGTTEYHQGYGAIDASILNRSGRRAWDCSDHLQRKQKDRHADDATMQHTESALRVLTGLAAEQTI
jgi:outer membrane scaffolding protein for murein synthesis (MipA/OmpV family)